jgi:hypothetical protein
LLPALYAAPSPLNGNKNLSNFFEKKRYELLIVSDWMKVAATIIPFLEPSNVECSVALME